MSAFSLFVSIENLVWGRGNFQNLAARLEEARSYYYNRFLKSKMEYQLFNRQTVKILNKGTSDSLETRARL